MSQHKDGITILALMTQEFEMSDNSDVGLWQAIQQNCCIVAQLSPQKKDLKSASENPLYLPSHDGTAQQQIRTVLGSCSLAVQLHRSTSLTFDSSSLAIALYRNVSQKITGGCTVAVVAAPPT